MRKSVIILAGIGAFLCLGLCFAGDVPENLYCNCIDKKIALCLMKAGLLESGGPNSRIEATKYRSQADFYLAHKQELVREMIRRNVGAKPHRTDYFLTSAHSGTPLASK